MSSLIQKTIKFSTVFEFNDFNEVRYRPPLFDSARTKNSFFLQELAPKLRAILQTKIHNHSFRSNLLQLTTEHYRKEHYDEVIDLLNCGSYKELLADPYLELLCKNLAFSSVGIFCISKIDVFKDDSAALMFAHYADNLSGLALIYEIDETSRIKKIKYDGHIEQSGGPINRVINWHNSIYEDIEMEDFLCKSKKWEYEQEYRLFSSAQEKIKSAQEWGITLKAILHTPRFSDNQIATLKQINQSIYHQKLFIQEIFMSTIGKNRFEFEVHEGSEEITCCTLCKRIWHQET
ncbi:MAG: DUF2971 domain-containing protein [Ottowia sp.]|nr:DUF2971 domain-containing protein [Ottowia sp.]